MCKTVEDAALMLSVVARYDEMDPVTVDVPVPDYVCALKTPPATLRLGIPRAPFFESRDPEVTKPVEAAIDLLRKLTASVKEVKLPPGGNPAARKPMPTTPNGSPSHPKNISPARARRSSAAQTSERTSTFAPETKWSGCGAKSDWYSRMWIF
jgi:Asp-tRNA(Asn)/Glu-tRNA(Gln) amidotransferase A subunit family amidase